MSVARNLEQVLTDIASAVKHCGRPLGSVKLVAVSKGQGIEKILAAYKQGQRIFAENYVQEALEKLDGPSLPADIQWHFVGRLQSNKIKQIVGRFALIHSVDRLSLAQEISKRAQEKNLVQTILLQVNIGGEVSKGGANASELEALADQVCLLAGVKVVGLMVMPPLSTTSEEARKYFQQTQQLFATIKKKHPMSELSMGTSGDYVDAITEGATLVRIGSSIFGARDGAPVEGNT